jgi:hypothetical protein
MNYLDKLKHLIQRPDTDSTIRIGDRIEWERADLTVQYGVVDFLQTYPGEVWAFCTLPDGEGIAVNVKYMRNGEAS